MRRGGRPVVKYGSSPSAASPALLIRAQLPPGLSLSSRPVRVRLALFVLPALLRQFVRPHYFGREGGSDRCKPQGTPFLLGVFDYFGDYQRGGNGQEVYPMPGGTQGCTRVVEWLAGIGRGGVSLRLPLLREPLRAVLLRPAAYLAHGRPIVGMLSLLRSTGAICAQCHRAYYG
jgi:hypothetical protein